MHVWVSLELKLVTGYNIPCRLSEAYSLGDTRGEFIASLQPDTESQLKSWGSTECGWCLCSKLSYSPTGCSGLPTDSLPHHPLKDLGSKGYGLLTIFPNYFLKYLPWLVAYSCVHLLILHSNNDDEPLLCVMYSPRLKQ